MTSSVNLDLWLTVLTRLESQLKRTEFITWFKDTTILGRDQNNVVVGLPRDELRTLELRQGGEVMQPSYRGCRQLASTGCRNNFPFMGWSRVVYNDTHS
jgi:hypothetical protein